jgi:hypothetical protein
MIGWYITLFDNQATNLVMVKICSKVGSMCHTFQLQNINLIKVTMIEIIWIMLHSICYKIGVQGGGSKIDHKLLLFYQHRAGSEEDDLLLLLWLVEQVIEKLKLLNKLQN